VFDIIIFEFDEYVGLCREATSVFSLFVLQAENINEIINRKTKYFFIKRFLQKKCKSDFVKLRNLP